MQEIYEKLAIIILNYENYQLTQKCIENLLNLSLNYNIIVVDNASKNKSYEILKKEYEQIENIKVIKAEKNGGYAYGNNIGIKECIKYNNKLQYFCIMNPDVIITYDIFKNLIQKIEKDSDIAIIGALMVLNDYLDIKNVTWNIPDNKQLYKENILFYKNKKRNKKLLVSKNGIAYVDVVPGSFFVAKIDVFEKIGYFDEGTFLYNEENILSIKLDRNGYKRALSIGDYYFHEHVASKMTKEKELKSNQIGYNSRLYLCNKYYDGKERFKLKITYIINKIYIYIKYLLK